VFGWSADEDASFRVLDRFVDAGMNFVDTADVYSSWVPGNRGGESEAIMGRWMKSRKNRDKVIITTKVGSEMGPGMKGLSRTYILRAVDDSLRRLQTDVIDLYLSHWEDPATSAEETMGVYAELVRNGKVRVVGNSNHGVAAMTAALEASARHGWPRFENLQTHYNLYDRKGYEAELEAFCRKHKIGVTSYFSLAKGFLSGKYRSEADFGKSSARGSGMSGYLDERGHRILDALDEVAASLGATPAQVAIAWLIARPGLTAAIASATKVEQLDELVAAATLELPGEAAEALTRASA
jgi:aryl-alcohol dehydrogenase-like predicted oxidoreductase